MPPTQRIPQLAFALALLAFSACGEVVDLPPVAGGVNVAADRQFDRILVLGSHELPNSLVASIAAPYLARPLTVSEIEALRQDLTRAYVDRGFINSGLIVDDTATTGGTLAFRAVEGRIGDVRIAGLQHFAPEHLAGRLARDGEVFNLAVLQERMQLLLADPAVRQLRARVVPGAERGLADLEVDIVEAPRTRLTAFLGNHQSPATGQWVGGLSGEVRNLAGHGDHLVWAVQTSGGQEGYQFALQQPLPAAGVTVRVAAHSSSAALVEAPMRRLEVGSRSDGWEAGLAHALVERPAERLNLALELADRVSATTLGGASFAFGPGGADGRTRVREWRFAQEYARRGEATQLALRSIFGFGENNAETVSGATAQTPRRFRTWIAQAQLAGEAIEGSQWVLRGSGQWANAPLVAMSQFALGGAASVRGYRENQLVRDRGFAIGAEWRFPLRRVAEDGYQLTLFPLLDYGEGWNAGQRSDALSSVGVGLTLSSGRLDGELVLAQRIARPATPSQGALQDDGVHFTLRYRFF